MRGDLDFADSLRARVRLLAGLDEAALDGVRRDLVARARGPHLRPHPQAARLPASRSSAAASPRSPTGWSRTSASTTRRPTPSRSSTAGSPASCSVPSSTGPARPTRWSGSPREAGVPVVPDRRDRRRRQRPGHAGPGRAGHRLQRQAGRPGRRRRRAERAVPGRDPVPARHLPRRRSRRPTRPRASRCSRRRPDAGLPGAASRARRSRPLAPASSHDRRPRPGFSPCRSPVRAMTTCSRVGLCPTTTCTGTSVGARRARAPRAGRPGTGPGPTTTSAAAGSDSWTRRPGLLGPARRGHPGVVDPVHLAGQPAAGRGGVAHARER